MDTLELVLRDWILAGITPTPRLLKNTMRKLIDRTDNLAEGTCTK